MRNLHRHVVYTIELWRNCALKVAHNLRGSIFRETAWQREQGVRKPLLSIRCDCTLRQLRTTRPLHPPFIVVHQKRVSYSERKKEKKHAHSLFYYPSLVISACDENDETELMETVLIRLFLSRLAHELSFMNQATVRHLARGTSRIYHQLCSC